MAAVYTQDCGAVAYLLKEDKIVYMLSISRNC